MSEGDLTGLFLRQVTTGGNCFIECAACSRRLGVSGRQETNELFRRGARLQALNENVTARRTDPEETRKALEAHLAGIPDPVMPVSVGSLTEAQRRSRALLGWYDDPALNETTTNNKETTADNAGTPRCTCALAVLRAGGAEQKKNGDLRCRTCHGLLDAFSGGVLQLQGVAIRGVREHGDYRPASEAQQTEARRREQILAGVPTTPDPVPAVSAPETLMLEERVRGYFALVRASA